MARTGQSPAHPTSFRRIWSIVARIPRGKVATYGQVARMAGLTRGARTAGWALQALPDRYAVDGRAVPWHRVINASGSISRRSGDGADLAVLRQAAKLRREGIRVSGGRGVDLERYLWSGERDPVGPRSRRTSRERPAR